MRNLSSYSVLVLQWAFVDPKGQKPFDEAVQGSCIIREFALLSSTTMQLDQLMCITHA